MIDRNKMTGIIKIEKALHKNKDRIKVIFNRNKLVLHKIKQINDCRWSATMQCWHVPYNESNLEFLKKLFLGKEMLLEKRIQVDNSKLNKKNNASYSLVPKLCIEQMKIKRYSVNTIKTYTSVLNTFFSHYKEHNPNTITEEQIRKYMLFLVEKRDITAAYQRQVTNAIKFYYENVLGRQLNPMNVQRPRKSKKLPVVFSENEVAILLSQVNNLKHKCILYTIYAAGLRRSEVLNLKLSDIDSERNCIIIRDAKGNKDRNTLLSKKLLFLLREYYKEYKPKEYLFE